MSGGTIFECSVEGGGSRSYTAQTTNGCAALLANFPNFTANISVGGESKLVGLKFGREIFSTEAQIGPEWQKWVDLGLHWVNVLQTYGPYDTVCTNDLRTAFAL